MSSGIIEFRNVAMEFDTTVVHRDISFSINQAETVTLLGPSGTGKTVILRLIIGLLFATRGEVKIMDSNIDLLKEDELHELRTHIGILFQGSALFDSLNVYDNVAYSLREHGEKSEDKIRKIVTQRLEVVGLPEIGNKFPAQLSGGQKKRVGLARALASSPKIVLFDEPTTGLDPTAVRMIDDLIIRLRDEFSITSVVVTHDIASARQISNRWILLRNGYKIADGSPEVLAKENEDVIEFITGTCANDE